MDKWVHYVAYFPPNWGPSTYTDAKLWINGTRQTLSVLNGSVISVGLTSLQDMRIGGGYNSGDDVYNWHGKIAITNVYNAEISDDQVLENFNEIKSREGFDL